MSQTELRCPANYFGKGETYNLQDATQEELLEFNRMWEEWERAHPDDPTGDLALAAQKESASPVIHFSTGKNVTIYRPVSSELEEESTKLKVELPADKILKLKNYARYHKRRPRDIIACWIDKLCILD